MSEFRVEYENDINGKTLVIHIPQKDDIDKIAVNVLKQDCPDFVIPMNTMEVDGVLILKYQLKNLVSLKYAGEYLQFHEREFLDFLQRIIEPFIDGGQWFLDYHNYYLESQHIFLDRAQGQIKMIYFPFLRSVYDEQAVRKVLIDILSNCSVRRSETLPSKLITIIKNNKLSLGEISEKIKNVQRMKVKQPIQKIGEERYKKPPEQQRKKKIAKDIVDDKNSNLDKEEKDMTMEELFGDNKKKKNKKTKNNKGKAGGFSLFKKKSIEDNSAYQG